jgi:hypothetical protein
LSPTHGLGQVFRNAEFRALWAAELCSIVGDQLAWRWWRAAAGIRGVGSGGAPISNSG